MEIILGLFTIIIIILIFVGAYKSIYNPEHDYSGNLDKQREDYENTFPHLIDIIKSLFKK